MKIDLHVHSKTGSDGKLTMAELFKEARSRNIGLLVHAHPNDPNGTSLISLTPDLNQQTEIIEKYMLNYIDGIE